MKDLDLFHVPTRYTYSPKDERAADLIALRWCSPEGALTAWRQHILDAVARGEEEKVLWTPSEYSVKLDRKSLPSWLPSRLLSDCDPRLSALWEHMGGHLLRPKRVQVQWHVENLVIEIADRWLKVRYTPLVSVQVRHIVTTTKEIDGQTYKREEEVWHPILERAVIGTGLWVYTAELEKTVLRVMDWPAEAGGSS